MLCRRLEVQTTGTWSRYKPELLSTPLLYFGLVEEEFALRTREDRELRGLQSQNAPHVPCAGQHLSKNTTQAPSKAEVLCPKPQPAALRPLSPASLQTLKCTRLPALLPPPT